MTKKKTLLEEGTVRQFMKLANLTPIASDFVERLYEGEEVQEEDKAFTAKEEKPGEDMRDPVTERSRGGEGTLAKTPGHGKVDYVNEDDKADDDWGGNEGDKSETDPGHIDYEGEPIDDEGGDLDAPEGGDVDVNSLVRAIAAAIESETGVSVDVAEEEEGLGDELGGDEELEASEEEVDLGGGDEMEEEDLEAIDLEEVVSAIAENVTKRLKKMSVKKQKVSSKKRTK